MPVRTLSLFVGPLLDAYSNAPALDRQEIEDRIWSEYGQELVVLVLDMSGFSLLTHRHGIVFYLSMVRRMQHTAGPIISGLGGEVVKFEADNCFAVFRDAQSAVTAAQAIRRAMAADPHPERIHVSIGIDSGRVLMVDHMDVFGHPVNRASKLGEDIAEADQILITAEVYEALRDRTGLPDEPTRMSISGIEIDVISI